MGVSLERKNVITTTFWARSTTSKAFNAGKVIYVTAEDLILSMSASLHYVATKALVVSTTTTTKENTSAKSVLTVRYEPD